MSGIIELNNSVFWRWMTPGSTTLGTGLYAFIDNLTRYTGETGYIAARFDERPFGSASGIMENLSLTMPREYFLELQFCASTYATFFGKVFPPLASHVDELAYIEWLLYMEPGHRPYRDHLVHMFKVAFVADQLLSIKELLSAIAEAQFGSEHFCEWCQTRSINPLDLKEEGEDIVRIACFIASLFHDFGYGYFFLRKYKERLFRIYRWLLPGADPVDSDTSTTRLLIESLPAQFITKYHGWVRSKKEIGASLKGLLAGFFRDCLPINHSVASMFCVLNMAESLLEMGALTQKVYVAFQLAAEACMIHDMTGEGSWLHLRRSEKENHGHFLCCADHINVPLAMLLILADELSIWQRYSLVQKVKSDCVITRLDKSLMAKAIEVSIQTEGEKSVNIVVKPKEAQDVLKRKFGKLKPLKTGENDNESFFLDYKILFR